MVDVTSRLRLVVDSTGVDKAGRKLKNLRRGARDADTAAARLRSTIASIGAVVGTAFSVRALANIADEFTQINNRLRLVTSGTGELNATLKSLGVIARDSQANLEATVTLFSRIEQFAGDAFESQQQALDFTGAIQNAFLAAGASATEASNAVRQLTQGLASGELRGEEFRSVSEQAPLLAKAIAEAVGDGAKSAFELAKEGAFTTEVVVDAVLGKLELFKEQAATIAPTIGRSFEVLRTQVLLTLGPSFQQAGEQAAKAILFIGDNLDGLVKAVQGLGVALGTVAIKVFISTAAAAVSGIQKWFSATVALSTANIAAAKAQAQYNAAIASGAAIEINSMAAATARASLTISAARADEVAAAAKLADIRAGQAQLKTNLELIAAQRAQAASQLQLARGIAATTGARTQVMVAEANLTRAMAAGIATRKALAASEAELVAAQNAHAASAARVAAAETAYGAAAAKSAAHVGFLGRAFSQLRAVIIGVGAILAANPLGVLVAGVTAAVAAIIVFRDEIAELTFGVHDAGAVIQAVFEVIGEKIKPATDAVMQFAQDTVAFLSGAASSVFDFFKALGESLANFIPPGVLDNIKSFASAVVEVFVYLARSIAELMTDALLLPVRGIEKLYGALSHLKVLPESVRKQFKEAEDYFQDFANHIDSNVGGETIDAIGKVAKATIAGVKAAASGVIDTYDEIKIRAAEIADARNDAVESEERAERAARRTGDAVARLAETYKAMKEQAEKAAKAIEESLKDYIGDFSDDVRSANLQSPTVVAALAKQFEDLTREIDHLSIGLNEEQLTKLYKTLEEAGENFGESVAEEMKRAADYHAGQLKNALGYSIDDLLFNGGKNLGSIFENFARDAVNDNIINPIVNGLNGGDGIFGGIKNSFSRQLEGFQKTLGDTMGSIAASAFAGFQGFEIGKGLSDLLGIQGNNTTQTVSSGIGGGAGAAGGFLIGGPVGAAIGAAIGSALGNIIGGLFSKPSDNTAQGVFNPSTGTVAGVNQDGSASDPNAQARDELLKTFSDVTTVVTDLIGGQIGNDPNTSANESFLNLAVRTDRKSGEQFIEVGYQGANGAPVGGGRFDATEAGATEALNKALELTVNALKGGESALLDYAKAAVETGTGFEDIIGVLSVLDQALESGKEQLGEYAVIAANAGLSPDDIISGLNALDRALSLNVEPLSDVAQELQNIDDAIAPAIDALQAVGQSIAELESISNDAARAVGSNFIESIQGEIDQFQNAELAELKSILKEQEKDLADAQLLLARGAITENEYRLVEQRNALEQAQFFEGLSEDTLAELNSFLGLFDEATNSVVSNLKLSRQDLQSQFDSFTQYAQDFAQLDTDFAERFVAASPSESLDILRARASELLGEVGEGNASAAQALPQVLNQLVENARSAFGNTDGFTDVLDFARDITKQAEAASLDIATEAERQIQALDESNIHLEDIKDILQSATATNAFFQSYASGGIASADELLGLIQSGSGITASNDNASALNITGIIAQTVQPIIAPLANSIDNFTQRLADMPNLMRIQIEATETVGDKVDDGVDRLISVLERIERLEKAQLVELEAA